MKHKYLLRATIFCIAALTLFNACNKNLVNQERCDGIACAQALPLIVLDFVDKQGRDLLNPATPGHYDSLKVIQLNQGNIIGIRQGTTAPNANRRKLIFAWKPGETTTYLKLSDADQDTVYYNQTLNSGCCINYTLTAFRYNGKAYTDSVARHYFTVVK